MLSKLLSTWAKIIGQLLWLALLVLELRKGQNSGKKVKLGFFCMAFPLIPSLPWFGLAPCGLWTCLSDRKDFYRPKPFKRDPSSYKKSRTQSSSFPEPPRIQQRGEIAFKPCWDPAEVLFHQGLLPTRSVWSGRRSWQWEFIQNWLSCSITNPPTLRILFLSWVGRWFSFSWGILAGIPCPG